MTNSNRWLNALFMMILLTVLVPSVARASECYVNHPATVNIPMQTVTPSEKGTSGTVLNTYEITIPQIKYGCGTTKLTTWVSDFVLDGLSKGTMANVYDTTVQGIGIRVQWPLRNSNSWVPDSHTCQGGCILPVDKIKIEIIQTGFAESGKIAGGVLLNVKISDNEYPDKKYTMLTVNMGEITVNVRSCSIVASNSNIELGEYTLADVRNSNFNGDKKDFSITLNCPYKSSATIRFEGKNAWGQSAAVLETDGAAENVFVTLYTKRNTRYTELALNKDINFGSTASFIGIREVKYAAQMTFFNTMRDKVTAGDVNASVIYTLTIN